MLHPRILSNQQAILLIIDVQEAFRKVLANLPTLISRISIMAQASQILQLPVFLTEQYPQGLGKTLSEISAHLGNYQYFEKQHFSCFRAPGLADALQKTGRKQIMVSGIEAHVCVNQTVHDLLQVGYHVHLLADAIESRNAHNKEIAMTKMVSSGAIISSVEMALFEMLTQSGTDAFKTVQKLVK